MKLFDFYNRTKEWDEDWFNAVILVKRLGFQPIIHKPTHNKVFVINILPVLDISTHSEIYFGFAFGWLGVSLGVFLVRDRLISNLDLERETLNEFRAKPWHNVYTKKAE